MEKNNLVCQVPTCKQEGIKAQEDVRRVKMTSLPCPVSPMDIRIKE
jgi:hypothetical protein